MISAIWYLSPFQPALAAALFATASSTGKGGLAGHLGHPSADPHGPVCGCGRVGCVEATSPDEGWPRRRGDDLAGCDAVPLFIRAGEGHQQRDYSVPPIRAAGQRANDRRCESDYRPPVCVAGGVGVSEDTRAGSRVLMQEPEPYHVALSAARYRHDADY